jgi:hypothetical protein
VEGGKVKPKVSASATVRYRLTQSSLVLFFCLEDRGDTLLRNVGITVIAPGATSRTLLLDVYKVW